MNNLERNIPEFTEEQASLGVSEEFVTAYWEMIDIVSARDEERKTKENELELEYKRLLITPDKEAAILAYSRYTLNAKFNSYMEDAEGGFLHGLENFYCFSTNEEP